MTDKTKEQLTEQDDELIPVETPPEETKPEDDQKPDAADDDDSDDDGEEDSGDERLGESEDDNDADVSDANANRERRRKRRELQKAAKERAQRELEYLRRKVAELEQRSAGIEGQMSQSQMQVIEQRLAQARNEAMIAEQVFVKATQAGNDADARQAMQIRDAARATAQQLEATKQQYEQAQNAPRVDPQVLTHAQQWMAANPWYDPSARDPDSALTKRIDNELAREGYDPATRLYWEELTARVSKAFGAAEQPKDEGSKTKRKTPPPTGATREHAPRSTKNEIYVTPERKQAMIDAGVWDDPVARQRYLKAYRDYDQSSAR